MDAVLTKVSEIVDTVQKKNSELHDVQTKAYAELKEFGQMSMESKADIKKLEATLEGLGEKLIEIQKKNEEQEKKEGRPGWGGSRGTSLGELWVASAAYKAYKDAGIKHQRFEFKGLRSIGDLRTMTARDHSPSGLKALTGLSDVRDTLATERLLQLMTLPHRPERIRNLIPVYTTSAASIQFIRQTGHATAAAAVAEGDEKPESSIAFEQKNMPMSVVAHWIPVSNQTLDDIPSMQQFIENEMIEGLLDEEDDQIIGGDGLNDNLTGILTDTGIQEYSQSEGAATDTKIDAVRRAITKVWIANLIPTGVILHPLDFEDIELAKDNEGRYLNVPTIANGRKVLWRLPVTESTAMPEGEFIVANFDRSMALWDNQTASIAISDSHADFFIRNMKAIRAEERLALTIFRPEAVVHGIFDGPGSGS